VCSPRLWRSSEEGLAAELRATQTEAAAVERRLSAARKAYLAVLATREVAVADLGDALDAKKSLCHQLRHLLSATETEKFLRMLTVATSREDIAGSS
jgi:uncharacterized membrane protein